MTAKCFVSLTHFIVRIITSDWGLADWVQRLIGTNRVCYASEKSMVDPKNRLMEMHSKNLTFNSYVNMEEKMTYTADPEDNTRTMLKQEMIVTVQGVPLTSYMEGIIVNTVSKNSSKGKAAIEWVVEKLGQECRLETPVGKYFSKYFCFSVIRNSNLFPIEVMQPSVGLDSHRTICNLLSCFISNQNLFRGLSLYSSLDSLKSEIVDLKHSVAESLILPAKKSIEELQQDLTSRIKLDIPLPQPPRLQAEEQNASR